jgi:CheY-like chemotaxis protein
VTADSVPTAMRALAHEQPDLLIVDIRLQDYNGLQLVAMAPTPLPAIVVTGFADPVLEADARRLGADSLLKPVSPRRSLPLSRASSPALVTRGCFVQARRWPRRNVAAEVAVHIEQASARILDISYGGVRLEVRRPTGFEPSRTRDYVLGPEADVDGATDARLTWTREIYYEAPGRSRANKTGAAHVNAPRSFSSLASRPAPSDTRI